MEVYQRREEYFVLGEGERRKMNVMKRLVLMCGKVLFMEKMCSRNKHGRISMTKPLEFYFK